MRLLRVRLIGFGPFRDASFAFRPGLNLVTGPNEAGKSSIHAGIRAALCGVRRPKHGAPLLADREFLEVHRPLDGGVYAVEATVALEGSRDERIVRIWRDLANNLTQVNEEPTGRDVASEIDVEGSPDASRWLGLRRDVFSRTVCVDQAQILAVSEAAPALQRSLQAAAAGGADTTAADAIARIVTFRSDHVGADQRNATKPLRMAGVEVEEAGAALMEARQQHQSYLALQERADDARAAHDVAAGDLRVIEAAVARRRADEARRRLAEARALAAAHPSAPPGLDERDELADAVTEALTAWASRRPLAPLEGETAEEIQRRIDALPAAPQGDTGVHPDVADAWTAWTRANGALDGLEPRPEPGALPATGDLTRSDLEVLVVDLAETEERAGAAFAAGSTTVGGGVSRVAVLAGLSILAGTGAALAAATGAPAPAALFAVAALIAGGATAVAYRTQRRSVAAEAAVRLAALDAHARRVAAAETWDARRAAVEELVTTSGATLTAAIRARGEAAPDDPTTAYDAYLAACQVRADRALAAAQRTALVAALAARQVAEDDRRRAQADSVRAEAALREAAARCRVGREDLTADTLVDELRGWQARRAAALASAEQALGEWHRLQSLLDGRTLAELEQVVEALAARATQAAAVLEPAPVGAAALEADTDAQLERAREREARHKEVADQLAGELRGLRVPEVAACEERLQRAREERERVERLARTLDETRRILAAAQGRVQVTVARALTDAVRVRLPAVTGGRYDGIGIEPAELSVSVVESATGRRVGARYLSQGTREQVYLLLRAAMAQYLVTTGEPAPLLLDEVTAQADDVRKVAILETLREVGRDRQVILFSHDADVAAWARRELDLGETGRGGMIELPAPSSRAPMVASPA